MKRNLLTFAAAVLMLLPAHARGKKPAALFPDGTPVSGWFSDTTRVDVERLGRKYVITDHGVRDDSTLLQTEAIQSVIDRAAADGGGVIVVPKGTFLSGSLFFRPGTHLHITVGGRLKGSDAITNYKILKTRIEGQTIDYFAALVNADSVNGFTISGPGTIDGNGHRFWDEFWIRRKINRKCTNLEALRPRLVYISNSDDVTVSDVRLINAGYWTNHLYRCRRVKYLGCHIWSPTEGYPTAPSTDAIDLDVCSDVLIRDCYMSVNDDAVCLKGGKGTFVDRDSTNGGNRRIIVERCRFGRSVAGVTFGSEAWDCGNVIMRDCSFERTWHVVLFKMRPDTPQTYTDVLVENITGTPVRCLEVSPWMQFHDPKERPDMPRSAVRNVTLRNINVTCSREFCHIVRSADYELDRFSFENIDSKDRKGTFNTSMINGCTIKNVILNGNKR